MMKAAHNSMLIPLTKLSNHTLVIASIIAVLISISFFFLINKLNVSNTERKAGRSTQKLCRYLQQR